MLNFRLTCFVAAVALLMATGCASPFGRSSSYVSANRPVDTSAPLPSQLARPAPVPLAPPGQNEIDLVALEQARADARARKSPDSNITRGSTG